MDRLHALHIFLEVEKQGSFSQAARQLAISPASITRAINELEQWFGAQLFYRTTRQVRLTEEGAFYLAESKIIVEKLKMLECTAPQKKIHLTGRIKISIPNGLDETCFWTYLKTFIDTHPDVQISMQMTNRKVDLVAEGYDMALRLSHLADSSLIARRLLNIPLVLVASPAYLATYGVPKVLTDLKQHDILMGGNNSFAAYLFFKQQNKQIKIAVEGKHVFNDNQTLRRALIEGWGITLIPELFVAHHIKKGALNYIHLEDCENIDIPLYVVFPPNRYIAPHIRALIDCFIAAAAIDN